MNVAYANSRLILKALLNAFFSLEIEGTENLPKKGPFIVASNHVSHVDPVVVGVACNTSQLAFMAKRELFDMPIVGPWVKAVGCIPVERESGGPASLKKAVKKLKNGDAIGIFPEGRRSVDGSLKKPEPGIGLLAAKSGAPIVPMYVSGTAKVMPKGQKVPKPYKIKARIGKIVDISESSGLSGRREVYEFIGEKVINAIAALKDE